MQSTLFPIAVPNTFYSIGEWYWSSVHALLTTILFLIGINISKYNIVCLNRNFVIAAERD